MSDYPPPMPDPLHYYAPVPPVRPRPLSVSVIAWIAIVLAGLGVLGGICGIVQRLFLPNLNQSSPITQVLQGSGTIATFLLVGQIIGWLVDIVLLFTGIACLKLKGWGRRWMIYIMVFQLFTLVVGNAFNWVMVRPVMHRLAQQYAKDPSVQMGLRFAQIAQIVGLFIGTAGPLIVLYFFTRPHVKAAFAPTAP